MVNLNISNKGKHISGCQQCEQGLSTSARGAETCMHPTTNCSTKSTKWTPIRLDRKVSYAQNYFDFQFLKEGLQYGFKLQYFGPRLLSFEDFKSTQPLGRVAFVYQFIIPRTCFNDSKSLVTYDTLFDVAAAIVKLKQGAFLCKSDIKSAFRLLPFNGIDFDLLRFHFSNAFYFDKMIPFECRISWAVFWQFCFRCSLVSTRWMKTLTVYVILRSKVGPY